MHDHIPDWYRNAKIGIMVHWGLPSIPAFAPPGGGIADILQNHDWPYYFVNNPYAEWYQNSLRLAGSPARAYHVRRFNRSFPYQRLARRFNEELERWNPQEWADLFREVGARYVVMVSKHHDGFLMWPSESKPDVDDYVVARDVVGDLGEAVRAKGLRYGLYYSGLLDWTVQTGPIRDFPDLLTVQTDPAYEDYALRHFTELIDRYRPDILWNDIGLPSGISRRQLFHHYRAAVPEGVLNDRWQQVPPFVRRLLGRPAISRRVARGARKMILAGEPAGRHGDVSTIEYPEQLKLREKPFEVVRGIGNSFCYNEQEPKEAFLAGEQLIRMVADVVSKNGNILINVGPRVDGTIPREQLEPLLELARWMSEHGPAIYGTRPWHVAEGVTAEGLGIRYTTRPGTLFAIVLERPSRLSLTIPDLDLRRIPPLDDASDTQSELSVSILGVEEPVDWHRTNGGVEVFLPGSLVRTGPFVVVFRRHRTSEAPPSMEFYTDVI